ncbi:hypothetical protein QTP88_024306 [Uroleucon formosanum]
MRHQPPTHKEPAWYGQNLQAELGSEHSNASHSASEEHEFLQPIRTKRSLKKSVLNDREEEAYKFMKKAADSISEKDEWTIFGNFVTDNIKKLKPMNQLLAKRNITNWLLDMQMKEMEVNMSGERRVLPHDSPASSDRTLESENSISPSPLDIQDARGQGYSNGANMAGNYRGVQARIQEKNNPALYIPCASHCLNLAGVHSASINVEIKHFFETVESIFKFFPRSTNRWTTLMKTLKVSLKEHSDTRWSSKSNAIKPLNTQIKEVYGVLQNIIANSINADTTSSAQSLLKNINLTFLFYLDVWNQILSQVDTMNTKALQMKTLTLDKAARLIQALKKSLQEFRSEEFEENFTRASTLVTTLRITNTAMRLKKKKRLELYEGQDDGIYISEIKQLRININNAVDVFINQLN